MQSDLFENIVKKICETASILFLRSIAEVGYWEDQYVEREYKSLNQAIDDICLELKFDIFGRAKFIEKD